MAWNVLANNTDWEWNDTPADPGGAETALWNKQTGGIRINPDGTEIYTNCRRVGKTLDTQGELNKIFYDNV
jgi:hypothetical protein